MLPPGFAQSVRCLFALCARDPRKPATRQSIGMPDCRYLSAENHGSYRWCRGNLGPAVLLIAAIMAIQSTGLMANFSVLSYGVAVVIM